jgi:hypothetical protein
MTFDQMSPVSGSSDTIKYSLGHKIPRRPQRVMGCNNLAGKNELAVFYHGKLDGA